MSLRNPAFLTADNFRDILLNISILVIVALAQMMVIITRGIDLSVGSMIGLTAMMVSFTVVAFPGMPVVLALPLGMALGAAARQPQRADHRLRRRAADHRHARHAQHLSRADLPLQQRHMDQCLRDAARLSSELAKGTPLGVPNLILFAIVVAVAVFLFLNIPAPGATSTRWAATPTRRASPGSHRSASSSRSS